MFKCKKIVFTWPFKRLMSTTSTQVLERLENRTLLRVSGSEVSNFLQGLITNDIEHLSSTPSSMYTMFLNSSGRILYDSIIYRTPEKDTYLIECDKAVSSKLEKHLKLYRVRRKIDISDLSDEFKIYVLFDNTKDYFSKTDIIASFENPILYQKSDDTQMNVNFFKRLKDLLIYRDPRISALGARVITSSHVDVKEQLNENINVINSTTNRNYRWLRYSLGVGEGIQDLPPGDCFPLECNCDYLHGVSFHKGCYVGQELTARVHHTGMVRKRLMPIYFSKVPLKQPDEKIIYDNVNLGKFKGIEGNMGLGLLRMSKALAFKEIKFGDGVGITWKPSWWPMEAPKEKLNISKLQ